MAKNQKRITAKPKQNENEKYAFRCFLLRLGFIGDEYKVTWMNRSRKGSIDTDKIKSDYPEIDIEKYRKPEKKYREFKITPIKKKELRG